MAHRLSEGVHGWHRPVTERLDPIDGAGAQPSMRADEKLDRTTEMACRALIQVCETPDIVQPLRKEMICVLQEDGCK